MTGDAPNGRARIVATLALVATILWVSISPAVAVASHTDRPPAAVLYGDLLFSIFPNSLLPDSYTVTGVQRYRLSPPSRRHHAIGAVVVNLNYSRAGIIYVVFPNNADLHARWLDGLARQGRPISVDAHLPEGREITGWTMLEGSRVGITDVVVPSGRVLVSALTTSTRHPGYGDHRAALQLAHAGLAHLWRLNR